MIIKLEIPEGDPGKRNDAAVRFEKQTPISPFERLFHEVRLFDKPFQRTDCRKIPFVGPPHVKVKIRFMNDNGILQISDEFNPFLARLKPFG